VGVGRRGEEDVLVVSTAVGAAVFEGKNPPEVSTTKF
jgi:hypothetical protein